MKKLRTRLWFARIASRLCGKCGIIPLRHGRRICEDCDWRLKKADDPVVIATRAAYELLKDETFQRYGGYRCACCGCEHKCMLSIDHVNGGGTAHLMFIKSIGYRSLYQWLKVHDYPPGFQILCMGCNLGKARNGGVCPHKGEGAVPEFDPVAYEVLKKIIADEHQEFLERAKGNDFVDHDKAIDRAISGVARRQKESKTLDLFFGGLVHKPMSIRDILSEGRKVRIKCRTWSYDRLKRLIREYVKRGVLVVHTASERNLPALYISANSIFSDDCDLK